MARDPEKYKKLFEQQNTQAAANPYSSLFDYDKLAQEEEVRKQQLQQSQQKIIRTNAVGDALRLISDAVGGSKGATITPRAINPGILQATQRYNALGDQSRSNMERLRLQDLSMKEKDLSYGLGLRAQAQKDAEDLAKMQQQQEFASAQTDKEIGSREKIAAMNAKNDLERQKLVNQGNYNEISRRYQGEIEKLQTKQKLTGSLAQKGLFQVARYDDPATDAIVNRNQVISLVPALKEWLATQGVRPYLMPRVLQPDVAPTKIQDDQPKMLISQFPEFFKTRLPELSGAEPGQSARTTGSVGTEDMWWNRARGGQSTEPQEAQSGFTLNEEDKPAINTVIGSNATKEQKRSAIYSYLTKQGYRPDRAKAFAEYAYNNIN